MRCSVTLKIWKTSVNWISQLRGVIVIVIEEITFYAEKRYVLP